MKYIEDKEKKKHRKKEKSVKASNLAAIIAYDGITLNETVYSLSITYYIHNTHLQRLCEVLVEFRALSIFNFGEVTEDVRAIYLT